MRNFYGASNDGLSQPRVAWHPSSKYIYAVRQSILVLLSLKWTLELNLLCHFHTHLRPHKIVRFTFGTSSLKRWFTSYRATPRFQYVIVDFLLYCVFLTRLYSPLFPFCFPLASLQRTIDIHAKKGALLTGGFDKTVKMWTRDQ